VPPERLEIARQGCPLVHGHGSSLGLVDRDYE
jgi:hypothetical protein